MILPIWSNVLIIGSHEEYLSVIGYFLSYVGMTLFLFRLIQFTDVYCQGMKGLDRSANANHKPTIMYLLVGIDLIQLVVHMFFNYVFELKETIVDGEIYYRDIPLLGLYIHRIVCYIIFICIVLIFLMALVTSTKILREKYSIILFTILITSILQSYFIFSGMPIDRSLIAYGIFGIIIYYFAIQYRPLRLLDRLLSNMVSKMEDIVIVSDQHGDIVWINDKCIELIGTDNLEQVKQKIYDVFGDFSNDKLNYTKKVNITIEKEQKNFIIEKRAIITNNHIDGFITTINDNTLYYQKLKQSMYEAQHDKLTGLYNKDYLYSSIKTTLQNSQNEYYIIYINIKNFKLINDVFSNDFGDTVLINVADWIHKNVDGLCGRLIGDTFGIFIPKDKFDEYKLTYGLSEFIVKKKNVSYKITIHIGVYLIKNKDLDISIMFDRAKLAMSTITDKYTTELAYYNEELRNKVLEEQWIISDLPKALVENQIQPYLQPIVDKNGNIVGAEALARWIHPEKGFLPPISFIPTLENNGMISYVDRHIWENVCKILSTWEYKDLFISINISPKDFYFMDVVSELNKLVNKYNIDKTKLRIEITETAIIDESIKIYNTLQQNGFIVEMDDFGSGYSSFNMLKDTSIDILKIDMKFLSSNTDKSKTIIKTIIQLTKELDIISLTEGVETKEQYDFLCNNGCELFQGYYFSKPIPYEDFKNYIDTTKN